MMRPILLSNDENKAEDTEGIKVAELYGQTGFLLKLLEAQFGANYPHVTVESLLFVHFF